MFPKSPQDVIDAVRAIFADANERVSTLLMRQPAMRCREGRLFEDAQDEILAGFLYRRSAPIAAAVVVTIDLADADPN